MFMTPEVFVEWLKARRSAGETLEAIGADFGTSKQAVLRWLAGGVPSGPVMRLAEMLLRFEPASARFDPSDESE